MGYFDRRLLANFYSEISLEVAFWTTHCRTANPKFPALKVYFCNSTITKPMASALEIWHFFGGGPWSRFLRRLRSDLTGSLLDLKNELSATSSVLRTGYCCAILPRGGCNCVVMGMSVWRHGRHKWSQLHNFKLYNDRCMKHYCQVSYRKRL